MCKKKRYVFSTFCGSFKSAKIAIGSANHKSTNPVNTKSLGPQIANPLSAIFICGRSANLTKYLKGSLAWFWLISRPFDS